MSYEGALKEMKTAMLAEWVRIAQSRTEADAPSHCHALARVALDAIRDYIPTKLPVNHFDMQRGKEGYENYAAFVEWRSINGETLPTWDALPDRIKSAWQIAAEAIMLSMFARDEGAE